MMFGLFTAAWRALRDTFPGKHIKGFVFHWNQVVCAAVRAARTNSKRACYDYIRQLMALPFLPARHIPQTFNHHLKANETMCVCYVNEIKINLLLVLL